MIDYLLTLLVIDIVLAFAVGNYAEKRGQDGGMWVFISILISPVIAFIILLFFTKEAIPNSKTKCPYCKELILVDAIKCRHCKSDVINLLPIDTNQRFKKKLLPLPSVLISIGFTSILLWITYGAYVENGYFTLLVILFSLTAVWLKFVFELYRIYSSKK